jgi:hypothetical protein
LAWLSLISDIVADLRKTTCRRMSNAIPDISTYRKDDNQYSSRKHSNNRDQDVRQFTFPFLFALAIKSLQVRLCYIRVVGSVGLVYSVL